jgi:DNA topoisomerase-1
LAERKARRGNLFWGCTNYPKCDFTSNNKPVAKKCPECKSPYLVEKTLRSGIFLECPNKKKVVEEEAPAPKKRGAKAAEPVKAAIECSYSKRIGDAPALPTAETHGPVVEKPGAVKAVVKTVVKAAGKPAAKKVAAKKTAAKKSAKKVLQRA